MNQTTADIPDWGEGQPTASKFPFCQIINPPNLTLREIEKEGRAWGIFVPASQAEMTGFKPDANWKSVEISFGEQVTPGFISTTPIMVALYLSPLEVEVKSGKYWKYAGLSFLPSGDRSPLSIAASEERQRDVEQRQYRERSRVLVMFLNEQRELLQVSPFQLPLKGANGVAIVSELKAFRAACQNEYFAAKKLDKRKLPDLALANAIIQFKLGLSKTGSKAPFVCPVGRTHPSQKTGSEVIKAWGDRNIELVYRSISNILLDPSSEASQKIKEAFEANKNFNNRTVGEAQQEDDSPTADNSEMLRSQIASLKNDLEWSIDRLNSFIQSVFAGRTLSQLDEDQLLLIADEMTKQLNIPFEEPPY